LVYWSKQRFPGAVVSFLEQNWFTGVIIGILEQTLIYWSKNLFTGAVTSFMEQALIYFMEQ
jgi:hypothetical protein